MCKCVLNFEKYTNNITLVAMAMKAQRTQLKLNLMKCTLSKKQTLIVLLQRFQLWTANNCRAPYIGEKSS